MYNSTCYKITEIIILYWFADHINARSSVSCFWFTAKLTNPLRSRIVTSVQSAELYVTISLLRGSRQFPDAITPRAAR